MTSAGRNTKRGWVDTLLRNFSARGGGKFRVAVSPDKLFFGKTGVGRGGVLNGGLKVRHMLLPLPLSAVAKEGGGRTHTRGGREKEHESFSS